MTSHRGIDYQSLSHLLLRVKDKLRVDQFMKNPSSNAGQLMDLFDPLKALELMVK